MTRRTERTASCGAVHVASVFDAEDRDRSLALVSSIQDPVTPAAGTAKTGKFVSKFASDAMRTPDK